MKEEQDWKFCELNVKDIITIIHYFKDQYIKTTGMIAKVSITSRMLHVVNIKIKFEDIIGIEADYTL